MSDARKIIDYMPRQLLMPQPLPLFFDASQIGLMDETISMIKENNLYTVIELNDFATINEEDCLLPLNSLYACDESCKVKDALIDDNKKRRIILKIKLYNKLSSMINEKTLLIARYNNSYKAGELFYEIIRGLLKDGMINGGRCSSV